MAHSRKHFKPTKNRDVNFDESYNQFSRDWQHKAAALQIRRWRALKRELKGGY